jgi:hypothetical protein
LQDGRERKSVWRSSCYSPEADPSALVVPLPSMSWLYVFQLCSPSCIPSSLVLLGSWIWLCHASTPVLLGRGAAGAVISPVRSLAGQGEIRHELTLFVSVRGWSECSIPPPRSVTALTHHRYTSDPTKRWYKRAQAPATLSSLPPSSHATTRYNNAPIDSVIYIGVLLPMRAFSLVSCSGEVSLSCASSHFLDGLTTCGEHLNLPAGPIHACAAASVVSSPPDSTPALLVRWLRIRATGTRLARQHAGAFSEADLLAAAGR